MADDPPLSIVRLRLDVESMRRSVLHSLIDHQGEIQRQVEAETKALLDSGHLEEQIRESVKRHIDRAIDDAVKHAVTSWSKESPTVQQAIEAAVTSALWQTHKKD